MKSIVLLFALVVVSCLAETTPAPAAAATAPVAAAPVAPAAPVPAATAPAATSNTAEVLSALSATRESLSSTLAASQRDVAAALAALQTVESGQRQLLSDFQTRQQAVLQRVTESKFDGSVLSTEVQSAASKAAAASDALSAQLKRISTALDVLAAKPTPPPPPPPAPAPRDTSREDSARIEKSIGQLQTETNAKLAGIESAVLRLTALLETIQKENADGRSFAVRLSNFGAELKACALQCVATAKSVALNGSATLKPLIVEWIAGLQLQNRAAFAFEQSQLLAQHAWTLATIEGQKRVQQFTEFVIANGFPPAHAPLFALSVCLAGSMLVGLVVLWIASKTVVPIIRRVLSAIGWTIGLIALVLRSVLCCSLCRRSSATAGAAAAAAAAAGKKKRGGKKKSGSGGATPRGEADADEPPSEDEVIPPARK